MMPISYQALCVIFLLLVSRADAAHSRRRIVVRRQVEARYDRSITTFSADGRLAQVEYGMEASMRGSTVAAMLTAEGVILVLQNASLHKIHRIDHHIWLVTAGLSGDARVLASMLRGACQQMRLNFGEAPTAREVARMLGRAQHELTRTGGARPLGCTAIVVGIDPASSDDQLGTPRLYQTDPGGIVEECDVCAAGKGRLGAVKVLNPIKEKASSKASIIELATKVTKGLFKELEDSEKQPFDVWTIRPCSQRRGGMQATCYRNITKDTIHLIKEQ